MNVKTSTRMLSVVFALVAASSGCKKKEDAAPKPEPTAPAATPPATSGTPEPTPAAPAAPAAVKSEYTPGELWAAQEGMSRMDKMEKFAAGVTIKATVTKVDEPAGGEYVVEADAGSGHVLAITFADFGKAAKARALKAGDPITVSKCQLTNAEGNRLAVVTCDLN